MKTFLAVQMNLFLGLALSVTATTTSLAQNSPTRAKKVFTNEDLQKYRERRGEDSESNQQTPRSGQLSQKDEPKRETNAPSEKIQSETNLDRSAWLARLKKADEDLANSKQLEQKYLETLDHYQKKLHEAQTDFHRQTAQWQIEGTQKNLARFQEQRKRAEEEKVMVMEEGRKQGFKETDLSNQNSSQKEAQ